MTSTTMQPDRLYEIAAGRKFPNDRLPTPEELKEAESTLGAVEEFFTSRIAAGVIHTANHANEDGQAVTFEDVARLIGWADNLVFEANLIIDSAEKVMVLARGFLLGAAHGYHIDPTPFKDGGSGLIENELDWNRLRREYGFGRPRG